jgi:Flp pilus assembly secretin CpaC
MHCITLRKMGLIRGVIILCYLCALFFAGCGDSFNDKPGELEARATLSDIEQIRANPNVNNPLPDMYLQPPQRVQVADGIKLFYFTRQQPAGQIANIITAQLGYKVTANEATNQLVIHCANNEQADKILEFLRVIDLSPIQVNIDCMIVELYADKTMDRETTVEIQNLFGENLKLGGKEATWTNITTGEINKTGELLPNFPGASLRESRRSTFGMGIGYDSAKINILVDMLVSRGYLKILMNPTIETVNGRKAKIISRDDVPIEKIVTQQNVLPYSITEYQWVEDSLEVTPYVFADGSIGLNTNIKIGSSTKPKGVVQASVITERSITVEENRIKPGNSLIIGGIRRTEKRDVLRGSPFLKDIPVLGMLFSSRDFEESGTELIFILTPSISSGGTEYAKMLEAVEKKQASPKYEAGLEKSLTDPFGDKAYTEHIKQKAADATTEKVRIETEAKKVRIEAEKAQTEAQQAVAEAQNAVAQAEKAKAEAAAEQAKAEKLQAEAEKAKALAEKAKAQSEAEKAETEKIKIQVQQAQNEAQAAKTQAQQAQAESETAKVQALQIQAEAEAAKAQAQQAQAEADRIKAEAQTAKAQAQQAQVEADRIKAEAEREKAEAEKAKAQAQQILDTNTPVQDINEPAQKAMPVPDDSNQPASTPPAPDANQPQDVNNPPV